MKWFSSSPPRARSPLASNELFATLSATELRIVDGLLHRRRYLAGEVIFDEGEDGHALYLVTEGQIAVHLTSQPGLSIAQLGPGEFFGELGLLDDWPRSAQTRAITDCELAVLFRGDFEQLMDSHARIASRIAYQLAHNLGKRLRQMLTEANRRSVAP